MPSILAGLDAWLFGFVYCVGILHLHTSTYLFRTLIPSYAHFSVNHLHMKTIEPRHEKIYLLGFRPSMTQTSLLSYRSKLVLNIASRGLILSRKQTIKALIRLLRGWAG